MVNRISGLGSGMDIDGMVSKLMMAERAPQDKLKQKEQLLEWKQDAYRSINSLAASFRDSAFSLRFSANWQKTTATTSDSTKITVSSDSTAQPASHQLTVTSLATNGFNVSGNAIFGGNGKLDPTASISSQASALGFTLDSSNQFVINGKTISFSPSDSLNSIMDQVNKSGAGVTMTYDSYSDKVVISTNTTGSSAVIDFTGTTFSGTGTSGNVLEMLKLDTNSATQPHKGTDAQFTLDGLSTSRPSNQFTINGVTYNLLDKTLSGQTVTVNISSDTASIKKSIQDFVDKYNTLISTISSKLSEQKFRDYQPLTDDQKAAMKDSDITSWTQKAQSGLLNGDDLLQKGYNDFRAVAYTQVTNVSGSYSLLSQIGITTNPYNSNDPTSAGKLSIDNTKLDAALAADPQGVIDLFTNVGTTGSSDRGVAQQFYEAADNLVKSLTSRAGITGTVYNSSTTELGLQVDSLSKQIDEWTDKLSKKEDYYYQIFSAMDTAVANGNQQISWLQSQMK
ncbi:hypothetical protein SD70_12115 [Gordoniibacillus kamchatkensis]|uniref:Flagellar hook-associated protein 2 n=1 Tax=Gordoniibacillus kamchatkensis TaxID=1590651 RepID=A0ABR5AI09_9BACL|nr:flagellar filament capping protein FliD [Paenibacillus sp. VKM B-2647]KIL40654.1 hypothetical protein SD70_12115 [Paenibacillus sp. VKM B-2647]